MVEIVALASGALVAGFGIYRYFTQNTEVLQSKTRVSGAAAIYATTTQKPVAHVSSAEVGMGSNLEQIDLIPRTQEVAQELTHGINTSSVSLGLASTSLLFPPMQYASVPVLIYMGAPSARSAYDQLMETGKPSRALLETTALAICLGGGWYLIGSVGFWLYYMGRLVQHKRALSKRRNASPWALPLCTRLLRNTEAVITPTALVQSGDDVLVCTSEVVPVDGIVTKGIAWVQPSGTTNISAFCLKRVGDRVAAMDVIIAGELTLHVQKVQKVA